MNCPQAINMERNDGWVRVGFIRGDSYADALANAQRNGIVGTVATLPLPFILAFDIAHTSDRCDKLMQSLNVVAIKYGEAVHARVEYLETRLMNMHRGQGLCVVSRISFILAHVVDLPPWMCLSYHRKCACLMWVRRDSRPLWLAQWLHDWRFRDRPAHA